ncbi:hypothetical protein QC762_0072830 [Podospora pseudocomata]|uniref:Uncharacterized protein n=1 Tax=Podospora pseudocomata TaxID=2093779 RepID=A0ABR0GHT6_9PEZI|nr:hypothetical protein QC762_0072830 [Podospora pseudocomata]
MPTCILAAAGEWVRPGRIGRLGCQNCRVFALIPITSFHMRPSAVPCLLLASRRRPRLLRSLQSTYLRYRHTGKPESVPVTKPHPCRRDSTSTVGCQGKPLRAAAWWPDRSKIGAYINSYIYQVPEPLLLLL